MKRSELKMTGETYRMTPANWGDSAIMIDEDAASEAMAECFGEPCDPDSDESNKPENVEIAIDTDGNFFAILEPYWDRQSKQWHNENLYLKCQNPADAANGTAEIYWQKWEMFDDEDTAE
jgi:hypothetical protein